MQVLSFPSPYRQGEAPYDIFKDRMAAITQIIQGIKGRILNKYNKGVMNEVITGFYKALTPEQATEEINILNADPDESIYGDQEKLSEMAGQFVDYANMTGKFIQMGTPPTPPTGGLPSMAGTPTGTPTSEVMIPKGSQAEILNYIMNMPEGQKMDFKPALKYMQENRPKMMGSFSPMEEWVMNQTLGQIEGQESQKEKLSEDLKLAKQYSDYFTETEKPETKSWNDFLGEANQFIQNNPGYEITGTNPQTGSVTISKQDVKPEIKWEEVNKQIKEYGLKLTGMNVNPATNNVSYSFGSGETGITWEETINKANQFIQDNPDYEVTSTNPKTGSVTISKKGEVEGEEKLKDLTSADINTFNKMFYGDEENLSVVTPEDYEKALDIAKRTDKNYPFPSYLEVMEKNIQHCLDNEGKIISRGEGNKTTDEWFKIYEWLYPYYKDALKGQSPKYLPPEEIKKVGAIEGALTFGGVVKGDYGSALAGEGKPKDEKGYIIGETYRDEEGILWKYLGNDKWEEVEEKTTKKSGRK